MAKKVLIYDLSQPLDGAAQATADIQPADGNLMIDGQTGGQPVLASGSLEYLETQGQPVSMLETGAGQAALTLRAGSGKSQRWLRLPWSACNGATTWRVHLNPAVKFELQAHSDGGNIHLDLAGMTVSRVAAGTGGGNIDIILPDSPADLSVEARTGAGNVSVHLASGIAARIQAASGLGKLILDPRFVKIDANTYQSPDYESAACKAEISLSSGAGNVVVEDRRLERAPA